MALKLLNQEARTWEVTDPDEGWRIWGHCCPAGQRARIVQRNTKRGNKTSFDGLFGDLLVQFTDGCEGIVDAEGQPITGKLTRSQWEQVPGPIVDEALAKIQGNSGEDVAEVDDDPIVR